MSQRPGKEVTVTPPKKRTRMRATAAAAPSTDQSFLPPQQPPLVGDDSGPRHVHIRNVKASVRRQRGPSITIRSPTAPSVAHESFFVDGDRSFHSSVLHFDEEYLEGSADSLQDFDFDENFNSEEVFNLGVEEDHDPWVAPKSMGGKVWRATQPSCITSSHRLCGKKKDDTWLVKEVVPGGPANASVIPNFNGHVAVKLWSGEDRGVLKCHSRERTCHILEVWRQSMAADASDRLHRSLLSHLSTSMLTHIDAPLISAFVERWQPHTNSFHLPFGEMTIMLHDVWYILKIPVEGIPVIDESSISDLKGHVAELFGMPVYGLTSGEGTHWASGRVTIDSVLHFCMRRQPPRCEETQLTAWFFLLLGCTLFIDKSGNKVRSQEIFEALMPDDISNFSWGSATLAYLYRQLGMASRYDCSRICGCLTLLQCWIYEYFPCFRPQRGRNNIGSDDPRSLIWNVRSEDKGGDRLLSIRQRLDSLQAYEIDWMPYRANIVKEVPRTLMQGVIRYRDIMEPYMPDRVLRQLGRVQGIPMAIIIPEAAFRPGTNVTTYEVNHSASFAHWTWFNFPHSSLLLLQNYEVATDLTTSTADYMFWYTHHSHPRLLREPVSTNCEDFNSCTKEQL